MTMLKMRWKLKKKQKKQSWKKLKKQKQKEVEKEEEDVIELLRSKAFSRSEEHVTPPKEINKNKTKGIDMPITKKTLEQVQCNACLKYMSEKNLRYSHPKYCLERSTIDTPSEIPIPNLKVKNDEAKQ